jgi:hypothetical protein
MNIGTAQDYEVALDQRRCRHERAVTHLRCRYPLYSSVTALGVVAVAE